MDDDRTGDRNPTVGLVHTLVVLTTIGSVLAVVVLILLVVIPKLNGRILGLKGVPNKPQLLELAMPEPRLLKLPHRSKREGSR